MAHETSAFCLYCVVQIGFVLPRKTVQNCFTTYFLVNLAIALNLMFGQILHFFSSRSALFSSHSSVLIGGHSVRFLSGMCQNSRSSSVTENQIYGNACRREAAEIQIDFAEEHKILGTEAQRAILNNTPRHVKTRERKGPSQGVIQKCEPCERSPRAPKFKDRSEEETLKQERCARRVAWKVAKSIHKPKEKDKATLRSPSEVRCLPAPSSRKPEER